MSIWPYLDYLEPYVCGTWEEKVSGLAIASMEHKIYLTEFKIEGIDIL